MKHLRSILLLVVYFASITTFFINTNQVHAATSETSAKLALTSIQTPIIGVRDIRAEILKTYLERNDSPLASYSEVFVKEADKNNIDWKLLVAISGVESTFGKAIPSYSFNGWGFGIYGNHVLRFHSWEEGIATVSQSLRNEYMDKYKAKNIHEIGSLYASDNGWAYKVDNYMQKLSEIEEEQEENRLSISF